MVTSCSKFERYANQVEVDRDKPTWWPSALRKKMVHLRKDIPLKKKGEMRGGYSFGLMISLLDE